MAASLVSESIKPEAGTFDAVAMSIGEPGLPASFQWRKRDLVVGEVLERWKEHGECTHGSGERYLQKHGFRIRTTDGMVVNIYFQRHFGRRSGSKGARWYLHSIEE